VELSSADMNAELLALAAEEAEKPAVRVNPQRQQPAEKPAHERVRLCRTGHCGQCPRCLDNARWERIFKEKFDDPTYYDEHPVKYSSPLA
jgi:hypothetical protein